MEPSKSLALRLRLRGETLVLLITLACLLTHFGSPVRCSDMKFYAELVRFFQGATDRVNVYIIRPVTPFIASFLEPFVGMEYSFALINAIFWLVGAIMFYKVVRHVSQDETKALMAAILFTSSLPLLRTGTAMLTYVGGYCFMSISLYLAVGMEERASFKQIVWFSTVTGLGILVNEMVLIALIYFLIDRLFKRDFKAFIASALMTMSIPLAWYLAMGMKKLIFTMYAERASSYRYLPEYWSVKKFLKSMWDAYLFSLGYALLGFLLEQDERVLRFSVLAFISSLPVLIGWPIMLAIVFFVSYPGVLALAGSGVLEGARLLSSKPVLKRVDARLWLFLLIAVQLGYAWFSSIAWLKLPPISV